MDNWELSKFRIDLSMFIGIINDKGVTGDFSELTKLLASLNTKSLIEYKFENLCFHINGRIAGTEPDDLNYCKIYFDNKLKVKDPFDLDTDPLYLYSLDINIQVFKSKFSTEKTYFSSWHLDRHPNTQNVKYTHPTYHFQFGGKKMEYIDPDMSVLSCPRIPHPPMDLFLGFHFILSNFFNNKQFPFVNAVLNDSDYQMIIKRAQNRLWKPYFRAFDSSNTNTDFTIPKIFPLYLN